MNLSSGLNNESEAVQASQGVGPSCDAASTCGESRGTSASRAASRAGAAASGMHIEDALATQGMYVGTTVGVSMRPMLRNRRDTIIVEPLHGRRLRRFEVPLYRRGSAYVLHRCVEVHPNSYTMLGDNCLNKEPNIPDERVIGVLTGFYRGNKQVNMNGVPYRAYVHVWYALYPLRRCVMRARTLAGRVKRGVLADKAAKLGAREDACAGASADKSGASAHAPASGNDASVNANGSPNMGAPTEKRNVSEHMGAISEHETERGGRR